MKIGFGTTWLVCALMASASATEPPHFAYSGDEGPQNWSKLSDDYAVCAAGRSQSPIDISSVHNAALPPLDIEYGSAALSFANNGHAVQADYAAGSTLAEGYHRHAPYHAHVTYAAGSLITHLDSRYELKQFHFHSPSEHTLNRRHPPAEIHFVHTDESGHLAVVAVLVEEGDAHPTISRLFQSLPGHHGERNALEGAISANDILPRSRDYEYYHGSLTTPPCTEGVRWIVMKNPITMSKDQIAALKTAIGFDNNRPTQPLYGRVVFD